LQQILFYRELGVSLEQIKEILSSPTFNATAALIEHRQKLLEKRKQLDLLISNVEKTIAAQEGRIVMSDKEKFEGFKQKLIDENERKYGKEIREKYGDEQVEKSNQQFKNMTRDQYDKFQDLEREMFDTLKEAMATGDPGGETAQKAADLHRQWITLAWGTYNKEAHAGVAQMYVCDERFKAYYDKEQPGMAEFLKDAILIYTGKEK
jgi:DNA-binding transcriptional MerR regulator